MKRIFPVAIIGLALVVIGLYYDFQLEFREQSAGSLQDILTQHRGQVLVLLLGRDGCPGTAAATKVLDEYVATPSKEIDVIRLDVPLPAEELKLSGKWSHRFHRLLDQDRRVADELEFFYYPTLYVFDREGEKRFAGGCDKDKIGLMVKEILAEQPGEKKKIYTLPQPAIGQDAPVFFARLLTGESVNLEWLTGPKGLLIFFSRTSCPFSMEQLPLAKTLVGQIAGNGVKVVIVNQEESADKITPIYQKHCAELPIIWDKDGAICQAFGVDAVPFFFLLNQDGKIVQRRSFTYDAALNAVEVMLGISAEKSRLKTKSAG
ncbi:MAG: TlpA family protein disulfide reductase [Planctomycetes bacterium]|nr:TlpA family protein disulfide reductase [Planctomycetota bacterium]